MELFLQLIVNGLVIGAIYSLASIGYSLPFALNINNFAHGACIMIGSYIGFLCLTSLKLNPVLSLFVVILSGFFLGLVLYFICIKPFIKYQSWALIVASTLAFAIILENIVLISHGYQLFSIRNSFPKPIIIEFWGVTITSLQIILILISVFLIFLFSLLLKKTKYGLFFKAVSDDPVAAESMGFSPSRIIAFTLIVCTGLGTLAGFLISLDYDQNSTVGTGLLMKSYVATVIGGSYNLKRITIAAYSIGIIENLCAGYISTEYMLASVFFVLVVFLLFKKEGLGILGLKREV